jgi:hypothetical protein
MKIPFRRLSVCCVSPTLALACLAAQAGEADDGWHGKLELKREATARGTPDETSKTAIKIDTFLDGPVSLFRIDMPFPDEKTDFEGSPFNPQEGDLKIRLGLRALKSGAYSFPSFVELTFPTANPQSQGSGKYQWSVGMRMIGPMAPPFPRPESHKSQFEIQLQHMQSYAGDPERNDVKNTRLELTAYDVWRDEYSFKLKLKPVVDWMKDGKTGATLEYETGWFFAKDWRTWLMLGARVWGPDNIASTYATRVELGVSRTF